MAGVEASICLQSAWRRGAGATRGALLLGEANRALGVAFDGAIAGGFVVFAEKQDRGENHNDGNDEPDDHQGNRLRLTAIVWLGGGARAETRSWATRRTWAAGALWTLRSLWTEPVGIGGVVVCHDSPNTIYSS